MEGEQRKRSLVSLNQTFEGGHRDLDDLRKTPASHFSSSLFAIMAHSLKKMLTQTLKYRCIFCKLTQFIVRDHQSSCKVLIFKNVHVEPVIVIELKKQKIKKDKFLIVTKSPYLLFSSS